VKAHLATLGKQTLVYGFSAAMLQVVGLVTLPVYARAFSPDEFGTLEVATVGMSMLLVLADLGMASASQRSYYDYGDNQAHQRRAVLATALLATLLAATALAVVLIACRGPISEWLFDSREWTSLVVLVALCLPTATLATYFREVMRLRLRPWQYTFSASLSAVVTGGLGVYLVVGPDEGLEGVLIGVLAGHAVGVVFGLLVTARHIGVRLSWPELGTMLRFGIPIVPAAAALWGLSFLDRLMLGWLADLGEVGMYAVGGRFAFIVMFVITAFGLAYSPFILSLYQHNRELEKQVRARALTYLTIALTGISLVLALFARELADIVAPGYDTAYRVVGVLCMGVTIFGLSSIAMTGISFARRSGYFAIYSLGAVVVNAALNLVLIPALGGFGAALATALAYAALTVLYYRKAQELYPTPYQPRKTILVLLLGCLFLPLGFLPVGLDYAALKVAGLLAFAALVVFGGAIDREEIAELRTLTGRLSPIR
jgi:O-antigen/teichoic acid export membrane protein